MAEDKKTKTDQKVLDLIAQVAKQKSEIAKIDRPNWKTNCMFSFLRSRVAMDPNVINLHVESDIRVLAEIAGFLHAELINHAKGCDLLGVSLGTQFLWRGYSCDDWLSDLRARVAKIQIGEKRKKLEALEKRLDAVISPELRAELELEAIAKELG